MIDCYKIYFFISSWVQIIIDFARKKKIANEHLFLPPETERAECCGQNLVEAWEKRTNDQGTSAKLYWVLLRSVRGQFFTAGFLSLLEDLGVLIQPFLLRGIIFEFGQENNSTFKLWLYSILLCAVIICNSAFERYIMFKMDILYIRIQSAASYLIFDKVCYSKVTFRLFIYTLYPFFHFTNT